MKKLCKFLLGAAVVAAAVCGVVYLVKNVLNGQDDDFDDFSDEDFDEYFEDEDEEEDREYVTLDIEKEGSEEKPEGKAETPDTPETEGTAVE